MAPPSSVASSLHSGRELGCGPIGEQRGYRNSHESMQSVPQQIKNGDFVGEEFDQIKNGASGNHIPARQQMKRWRQWDHIELREKTERGYGCVYVESGGKADGRQDGEEFVGKESSQCRTS